MTRLRWPNSWPIGSRKVKHFESLHDNHCACAHCLAKVRARPLEAGVLGGRTVYWMASAQLAKSRAALVLVVGKLQDSSRQLHDMFGGMDIEIGLKTLEHDSIRAGACSWSGRSCSTLGGEAVGKVAALEKSTSYTSWNLGIWESENLKLCAGARTDLGADGTFQGLRNLTNLFKTTVAASVAWNQGSSHCSLDSRQRRTRRYRRLRIRKLELRLRRSCRKLWHLRRLSLQNWRTWSKSLFIQRYW